jgi:hypothetical protein
MNKMKQLPLLGFIALLFLFVIKSNLYAQKITSHATSGFDKIESTGDYIFLNDNTPHNPEVPFFTCMQPNSASGYPAFYGMSMENLY